jgi:tetratricopeptide (TPR) repeat protein
VKSSTLLGTFGWKDRLMRVLLLAASCVALTAPAKATWQRASSAHFLIYADEKPEKLREFAVKLERFDKAVRALRKMPDMPVSAGNRVTIFVLRDDKAVQKLADDKTGFIAGFYRPSAEGSVAYVSRKIDGSDADEDVNLIFLHEYAHHLMMQELATPYPEWLIEGFAEFMASAKFERNGTVGLGLPAAHRAYGLLEGPSLPLETLLSGRYDKITVGERESIYGRGWLLSHYFVFEPARKGQLEAYLAGIAKGIDPLDAARAAFGDLKQLDRDVNNYLRRSRLNYWQVKPADLKIAPIEIAPISAGAVAVMPLLQELKNAATKDVASRLVPQLRQVASQFPGDLLVETTLSEAELTAENYKEAEAAADRALKADGKSTDAMILKGRAIMERGTHADPFDPETVTQARKYFLSANKLDPEDPEPLMYFYFSYLYAGEPPNANAVAALHYASDLAPQDIGLRLNSALRYLRDGKLKEARLALAPIAFNPHGREVAAQARQMIAKIDAGDAKGAEKAATE